MEDVITSALFSWMITEQIPTGKTHLEVFDRLHGSSVDLQLVLAKRAFQQFLICEFKGDFFVSSHSHGGLKFLEGPPYRTATETIIIGMKAVQPLLTFNPLK